MIRGTTLALALFLVSSLLAAELLPWHSVPETAAAVARGQQKMLLVYYRGDCSKCNDKLDAMFEAAPADEVFMHALDSFVPLRVSVRTDPARALDVTQEPLLREIVAVNHAPLVVFLDATGSLIIYLEGKPDWDELVEEMLRFRAERPRIIASVERRLAGQLADADMMLGNALLNSGAGSIAARTLERAAARYRKEKNGELAQMAELQAAGAWYMSGQRPKGRTIISGVVARPVSVAVAAEAHMMMGALYEADAQVPGATKDPSWRTQHSIMNDIRLNDKALKEYRKAYEIAPPQSNALVQSRLALARLDDQPLPRRAVEQTSSLRIVTPARTTLLGDSDFQLESGTDIGRVDWYLDDRKAGTSNRPPFRVSIDVGHVPSARTIKAVAFDRDGKAKGEASTTINDRVDAFTVSIVAPASSWIGGASDVELDVRVPPGRKLVGADVSWNGQEVAKLTSMPLRTKIDVPRGEFGYLRAVATLDNGTTTETTKVFNAAGMSESVEVGNVTVLATVNDVKGDRIGGLTSNDFSIRDEGQAVVPELRSTDEDPVTIGIAVDSSSSMAGRQLYVIRAATQFLARALRPQDQAFVVSFDTGARLVHPRSSNAAQLREVVFSLTPQGGTSIFDGVTFALQQFQGIPGKKALLVMTDGWEGTSSASARECERLARAMGVPVYVIVPPGGRREKNALIGISSLTGGTMFYNEPVDAFRQTFDRLIAEMRGQYVLSFTRPAGVKSGEWRSIRVVVDRKDANVRTIQGYRAN